jgi:hypothetical protein
MNRAIKNIFAGVVLSVVTTAQIALAVPPPAGVAPVGPPPGGFSIEGDLLANTPVVDIGDWILNTNLANGTGLGVITLNGAAIDGSRSFRFVDPYNDSSNDRIFSGGAKWTDDPRTWTWTSGKPSSKTDINNVLMHLSTDTNGHVWAILATDRFSTSGDSYIDFELLQNPLTKNANGTFSSAGPNGGRTTNDILLSVAFTGGGKVADFFASRWTPSGSGFAYTNITAMLPAGGVFVALNSNTIAAPYGAFGSTSYAPNAFGEAAIDLTALLGNFNPCESFGFKTIMIKTKASASSSASIEDFIDPIQYNLNIGPGANAGSDQVRCTEGATTSFALIGAAASGLQPVATTTWSVVSGDATIADPASPVSTANVSSASATLRLTVVLVNGCAKSDDIVLTVQQPPAASIAGPTILCPRTTNTYSAPASMSEYVWSISGNGSISGAANAQTVKVVAGSNCGQPFTLTLNIRSNACSVANASEVLVTDSGAPVLIVPTDRLLDCQASTATNATGMATATDTCSRVTVTYSDAVTNGCGVSKTIARTWLATDECGNAVTGVQNIVVQDITPPVLVCPTNRTVECSADTSPAATGIATATDMCGSAQVSYTDTETPDCGATKVIARRWTAIDLCGNTTTATQIITVRDTVAPALTIPPSVTLEAPANTSTNATGVATATDVCSTAAINYTDSIVTNCGSTMVISRVWRATDECGNSTNRTQTITVRDTTAPVIACVPDRTLEYPAVTTTNATGVATATDAAGSTVITYTDSATNSCGSTRTITRRWTATDQCGNTASCTQLITVRDTTPPVLIVPTSRIVECSQPTTTNFTGVATATDANGTPVISFTDSITNSCGATMTIARRWTATDACGNVSSGTQLITVSDTIPPVIFCPASLTLEAPAVTTTNVTGVATATDACSTASVTYTDSVVTNCGVTKVISRTWRATDQCGNSSSCVQTIVVLDTKLPALTMPTNRIVECGGNTAPAATGFATATDTSSTPVVTFTDAFTPLCGETKLINRTWTATDACGNQTNATQLITVRDTTPPNLVIPANVTQEAPGDTRTNITGVATALDGCGSAFVSYSETVTNSCGLTRTVRRLWTAVDQCGNSTNALQIITVMDTRSPKVTLPNFSVQCTDDVPAPYANLAAFLAGGGTATDNSTNTLAFALVSDSGLVGSCPGTVTRVYRVTDDCGNFTNATQRITVDDTIAPLVICPPSQTVTCTDSLDPVTTGYAIATDNCSTNLNLSYTDAMLPSAYNLNWYASDPAANSAPYLPTYIKFGPGSLAYPTNGRAADPLRNAVAYGPTAGQLDALTSLGGEPFYLGQIVPFQAVIEATGGRGPENGKIDFTADWATHTTSNDEFGYDKNYKVLCAFVDSADIGSVDPHFNARVDSFDSTVINTGANDEKIRGTFRISGLDPGDRIVVEVWVVLMSTQPDHVGGTIAADIVLANKLTSPVTPISTGVKTISIGSLNKLTQLPPPQSQPPLPPQPEPPTVLPGIVTSVIDRTWTATDNCGNAGTCTQRFTVLDGAAPILTVPANVVLEAPSTVGTNITGMAVASDTCGTAAVSYSDTVSNLCGVTKVISRRWTAIDQWGNSTNAVQSISVEDTTPPTLTTCTNKTIGAGQPLVFDTPTATDAGGACVVTVVTTTTNTYANGSYSVTRTWCATDACGNMCPSTSQTISVAAPVVAVPALDRLTISATAGGVLLRWPTNAANYRLESAAMMNLRWTPVRVTPVVTNGEHQVTLPMNAPSQLFRLSDGAPMLELSGVGGNLRLSWPTAPSGFQIESSTTMAPGSWTPVLVTQAVSNAFNHANVPITPGTSRIFFRLKK